MAPVRLLGLVGLLGISLVLLAAFYFQLALGEVPCPLCLLQRGCFIALGIGFLLHVRLGASPMHYAMILASALLGAGTALRQMLLHIAPGDPGYGSALFGLHMYSWSFIAFAASILYAALMLAVEAASGAAGDFSEVPGPVAGLVMWLFLLLAVANLGSTLLECGFGACPDNPTGYGWLGAGT